VLSSFELRSNLPLALETLIRLPSRDRESHTVPLRPLPAQQKYLDTYQKIRTLNLAEQLVPGNPIHDNAQDFGLPPLPAKLEDRFNVLWSLGPDLVIEAVTDTWNELHGRDVFSVDVEPVPLIDGPVRMISLKCRRGGVSSITQAITFLRGQFRPTRSITIAQKGKNAELVHSYASSFWRAWPQEYLDLRQKSKRLGPDAEWENGTKARAFTAGGEDSGRADQGDSYHISEASFFPKWEEVKATIAAAPAHANITLESTANGESGGFYNQYQKSLTFEQVFAAKCRQSPEDALTLDANNWNGFYRFFFSWLEEPAYHTSLYAFERTHLLQTLDDIEKKLVAVHGATPEQLQWRRRKIQEMGDSGDAAKAGLSPAQYFQQEFPADEKEAFQSTGARVFGAAGIDRCEVEALKKSATHLQILPGRPTIKIRRELATFTMFSKPKRGHLYSMGVDLSKGLAQGDWSVFCILDRLDGTRAEEAATWRARHAPEDLADTIVMLADWYNEAFIVPELEGPAISTVSRIVRQLGYGNVYHRQSVDVVKDRGTNDSTWQFGWYPSPQAKWFAIYDLSNALETNKVSLYSPQILHELSVYQNIQRKLGAPVGKNDDCVTAASLAWLGCSPNHNVPVDPTSIAEADRKVEGKAKNPDQEIWDYLAKLDARDERLLRKNSPFYKKNGYLPG
jgi:hypothetical protein